VDPRPRWYRIGWALPWLLFQFFPMIWVGNINQGFGALAQSFSIQIRRAIFGNDKVNVRSGSDDARAFF